MKRFLCPIDFSEAANNAIQYAANLAKYTEAELVLLHILEAPTLQDMADISSGFAPTVDAREKVALEKLNQYAKVVNEEFAIKCHVRVKEDSSNVENALKREIEADKYEMVIMGTNGADELSQYYFGTNSYKVARKIDRPLLIVPHGYTFSPLKRIIYAMDYEREDIKIIRQLLDFTKPFNPHMTVLHVSEQPTAISQQVFCAFKDLLEDELHSDPQICFSRIVNSDVISSIDDYMHKHHGNLLVLLTRQYNFAERLFHKSSTKNLSFIATYPILVYHK